MRADFREVPRRFSVIMILHHEGYFLWVARPQPLLDSNGFVGVPLRFLSLGSGPTPTTSFSRARLAKMGAAGSTWFHDEIVHYTGQVTRFPQKTKETNFF